ncbi:MAG: hypothetical protein WCX97_03730 [Candidatus Magasanikbacteria bacterium]
MIRGDSREQTVEEQEALKMLLTLHETKDEKIKPWYPNFVNIPEEFIAQTKSISEGKYLATDVICGMAIKNSAGDVDKTSMDPMSDSSYYVKFPNFSGPKIMSFNDIEFKIGELLMNIEK